MRPTRVLALYAGLVVVAVGIALVSSDLTYDYQHYGGGWRFILDGGNPWDYAVGDMRRFNAYGPLHSAMAVPYGVSTHLPKVIYAVASISATIYLVDRAIRDHQIAIAIFLICSPPLWILYVHGGFNDALIGALFLFGVVAFDRERFVLSAVLLALGVLYKFTPLFILPFLCVQRRRVNWRFSLTLAGCLIAGFGAAYLAWGAQILDPIRVGMDRPSSSASIFNFLDEAGVGNLDFLSTPLLGLSLLVIFACYLIYDLALRPCVVLALSVALLFYRANHLQFYFSLTLLSVYLVVEEYRQIQRLAPALLWSVGAFLLWLCGVVVVWKLSDHAGKQSLHAVIGLPTFLLHAWMNILLVAYVMRRRFPAIASS